MDQLDATLMVVHMAATAAMCGLIWFVQLVHYPLFHMLGSSDFVRYEKAHQRRTTWVVGPLMAIEAGAAIALVVMRVEDVALALPAVGLALLVVIHTSTLVLQVPAHRALARGHEHRIVSLLVASNWVRTVGWSARTVVAAVLIVAAVR